MNDDDTRHTRLKEGMKELETRSLHQVLLGAVFPLSTHQLVRLARENEAAPVVLSLLSKLPEGQFESLDAVRHVLESQAADGELATEAPLAPVPSR